MCHPIIQRIQHHSTREIPNGLPRLFSQLKLTRIQQQSTSCRVYPSGPRKADKSTKKRRLPVLVKGKSCAPMPPACDQMSHRDTTYPSHGVSSCQNQDFRACTGTPLSSDLRIFRIPSQPPLDYWRCACAWRLKPCRNDNRHACMPRVQDGGLLSTLLNCMQC